MGRTATAFLVLMAVGGCVADDQAQIGTFPTAKPGEAGVQPGYAQWTRSGDQFAALHEGPGAATQPAPGAPAAQVVVKATTTTAQKPAHKPAVTAPAAAKAPADVAAG